MASIQLRGLTKRYGNNPVVNALDLDIHDHEFLTLLGPSGCGKTTTLRMIAGFIRPDAGAIVVDGLTVSSAEGMVPPEKRRMGMVFQNYAVWPHKNVFDNVAYGLQVQRLARSEVARRVTEMLDLVGLGGLAGRFPNQLSGGQQQRVALARSLVVEPSILLLDEPLSNLDARLRERMRWELKQLQRRTGITFVYVTHDQTEAMALSDRIAVMHEGVLQQVDVPREVYLRPATQLVAEFMGLVNLVPGLVVESGAGEARIDLGEGLRCRVRGAAGLSEGAEVQVAVRPESIELQPAAVDRVPDAAMGRIDEATFLGSYNDYQVQIDTLRLRVQTQPEVQYEVGEQVQVRVTGLSAAWRSEKCKVQKAK